MEQINMLEVLRRIKPPVRRHAKNRCASGAGWRPWRPPSWVSSTTTPQKTPPPRSRNAGCWPRGMCPSRWRVSSKRGCSGAGRTVRTGGRSTCPSPPRPPLPSRPSTGWISGFGSGCSGGFLRRSWPSASASSSGWRQTPWPPWRSGRTSSALEYEQAKSKP